MMRSFLGSFINGFSRQGMVLLALSTSAVIASAQTSKNTECPPQAQPPTPEQMQAGMRAAKDRGFLWRIKRDENTSYMYGTLHISRIDWIYPGPQLVRALRASDTIALELDVLDADIQRRMAVSMSKDSSGEELLPDSLAERLQAQLVAACLPLEAMERIAPEIQLATLTTLAARWDGLDPSYAIDSFLAGMGRGMKKPVRSLESPELQIALLKGDPKSAVQMLEQGLQQLETGQARPMLVRIARVWADSQYDELARYEAWCDCVNTKEERAAMKRMLDDRNPALANAIDALHASGQRVFAAVGSLHFIGKLGLPELMKQRGYTVERIEFTPDSKILQQSSVKHHRLVESNAK